MKEYVTNDQAIKLLEKEFVPYEIARQMYLHGFDEPCFAHYSSAFAGHESYLIIGSLVSQQEKYHSQLCSAPLWQQAWEWLIKHPKGKDFDMPLDIEKRKEVFLKALKSIE
jgi:hypothetical protein